jgi:hypothetical protein
MIPPLRLRHVVPRAMAALLISMPGGAVCSPTQESPLSVLAAFEAAWAQGESDLVARTLASDKIALSLGDAGPRDETYTRTQAAYLIKDALAYRITESFEFVEFSWNENDAKPPYGVARWTYKHSEGGPPRELMLKVALRKEGSRWAVAEVRIQPDR